jgi:hypothetical protein
LEKTVAAGFEAKPLETIATSFKVKPVKTVRVVLRPNHSQNVDLGFESQPRNPTSRPPSHRVPDLCDHPRSSTQVSYSYHGPRRCTSCCTCHMYITRQANTILQRNKCKRKIKQNYPGFKFTPRQVNDSSQLNQETDHLIS